MELTRIEYLHQMVDGLFKSYAFYLAIFVSALINGLFNQLRACIYHRRYFREQKFDYREILIAQWTQILQEPCLFVMQVRFHFLTCQSLPLSQAFAFFIAGREYWRLLIKDTIFYLYAACLWLVSFLYKKKVVMMQFKTSFYLTFVNYLLFVVVLVAYYYLTLTAVSFSNIVLDTFYLVFEVFQLMKCFSSVFIFKMYQLTINFTRMYDFPHYKSVEDYVNAEQPGAVRKEAKITYYVPFVNHGDFQIW